MIDHKRNLYDALSTKFDIGTYEEFESKIDNEEHRKRLYDAVSQTYDIGTYDEYNAKLGYQSTVTDTNYEPTLPESEEDAPEMSRRERRQARREERKEARRNDDRPSWGESAAKGVGAGFTRTGKGLLDALHQLSAGMLYNDPETGEAKRLESYDAQMQDETNTFRNASVLASETAEELSREADPTGGEKGFVDLISEGKIGMALQKGLATGAESLPMTLSAYNPWTMALNAISMAGANYAEETLDNPEIDPWKRAVKAIGSAAIEQAVEKFADPVFKYIGGGKGAGELTEELAKELVEKGTKEATENIAKRIFRVLKNTAKDAAGEGVEEVVTSFGNDALGQALDWIDGDNDYGIRAQWEQMKSENPDADAWDFALAKGKEYMDSFIGGALSGGYMSGTANVFSEGAKFKYDRDARKILDESHAIGSSLDYGDMYDSDDTVREQMDAVAATFTNENGEASISGEFIGTLSSEDAFALSRRGDFTPEQRNALFGLARAKAIQEGLTTKLDERLESQVNAERILIDAATENGSVITAMHGGKPVYVMGALNKGDGTVTAPGGQNGPVVVIDAMTGEKSYARSEDIQFAESKNPDEYAREVESMLRQNDARNRQVAQNTMSVRAKAKAVKPFAGKKILVDVGNGLTEVLVQQISPKGEVTIKGKKGDLGGQSVMILGVGAFYDSIYRDEDGNPVITEAPQEAEAETPQEEAPVAETTGDEDYRGQTIPILLNGVPTDVEVMSQDNPSDSIVYEYTDANENRRTASSTIGAFNTAMQQAAAYVAPTPTEEETPSVSDTQAPQEVPVTPETIDWDALFEQDPEAYFVELQNQFGEEALDILNDEVIAAQEELDSLNKKRGKTQNERLENRKKKVALQERIDTLNGMIARLAPAEAPVVETPATETPAEVAPTEQPTATPETAPAVAETTPVTETPAVPESTEPAPVEQAPVAEAPAETVAEPEPAAQPTAEITPEPEPDPVPSPAPAPSKPTAKGGAIARMIGEAKKQISKLAAKANIKDFTVEDNTRPVFGGVLRKDGYEVASDSHILAKIKAKYPAEQEGKIYSVKTGQEIVGRFPNADMVISSAEKVNTEIEVSVDDILATAQAVEELKKGLDKTKEVYVRVGRSVFDSSYLLKAARMAKQQGLTTITQHPTEHRAMLFAGANGTVLVMPMNGTAIPNRDIIDATTGEAAFDEFAPLSVKTPASLKGIETARLTLGAILPNVSEAAIERLVDYGDIKLVDGKVVYFFNKADIANARTKAKDPNTYAALENIEKNGLEIPLSSSEIAKLFPESVAPVAPAPTESTPVAPNPVDNPAREAQKREKALAQQLQRYGISPEQKSDMAFNAGKAVGDFFATREEYDAYAENATDLGDYNADFERGVEASFANRQQNVGNSPVNSVPLENEPNGENNGEASTGESGTGQSDNGSVRQTSDGGGQEVHQGTSEAKPTQGKNKGGSKTKQVASKYPARKGNATQKLLKDTFGFESVTIPNNRKETLNAIYDFMMEMSKMLGISPKSIGQGGMLGVGRLNANARATAEHSLDRNKFTFDFIDASIKFKYAKLEGIAHEWWHALDYALGYFDSGKVYGTTTKMSDRQFSGRKETYDAVQEVMQAIKDSGYPARIKSLTTSFAALRYYLNPTEMAARAFDGYLRDIFAAAGISIEGASYDYIDTDPSQQTPEEMAVIAPAFDNLFKVLQEKEGKTPGTSVLYHIGEMMAEDSPAKRLATDAVLTALDDTGIDVVRATDKQTQQMLDIMDEVAEMQKGTAPETALPEDESSFKGTAISSADGAKIINNLDNLIIEYSQKPKNNVKTFIGDVARALEIDKRELPESSQKSRYATFEAKNGKIFTLRIANHNATVSFFDGNNESEGISVVISRTPNEGVANDGDAHIIEFFYKESDIVKSDGQPLVEILKSIKQSLYSGEYKDSTGLAKPQEVNAPELFKTPNGTVYGWTDGKKIYLTKAGINPNTPIHEYTHLWAKAMMQRNPKGWNSIKKLLKGTPVWNQVMNDPNYSSIHNDEDAVASEALSRISGTENAVKMEQMAQQMIDEAKGTARKLEARGLIQNMRDALNKFWKWVGTNLFGIEKFESVEQVTDRVLWDLLNNTDLGTLSEGQVETQIVTDPKVIAELEASPKRTGYRNVVKNEDGTFSSPMAYWLQGTKEGAKSRVETAKFELGKWEEAEEHPELVDEKGHVVLVKPNKSTVNVAYDPYIHNRLDPVNLQFKDAWKRNELVYVETVVPETDLESGYHADHALLPVGVHSWSNGDVMLSKYDKPVRIMPWEDVADAWVERLNGEGVHFDVVPPALRSLLVERGVEILPPHKGMGKDCNDAYKAWKKEQDDDGLLFRSSVITPQMDADYLAAVERGDMETAQRMVLEAAKLAMPNTKVVDENGNPKVVYHGTSHEEGDLPFTIFDQWNGVSWFTEEKKYAKSYTRKKEDELGDLYSCFLNFETPISVGNLEDHYGDFLNKLSDLLGEDIEVIDEWAAYHEGYEGDLPMPFDITGSPLFMEKIVELGYDGVIADEFGYTTYGATTPSQIKSADPVTYDDSGNVIPLSQRFNPLNPDIRYRGSENNSLSSQSYEGTGDTYTDNDGRGMPQEGTGVPGEVPVSGPLGQEGRLYNPEGRDVSQYAYARFNPIHEREGESDNRRNLREARFFEAFEKLTSDQQVLFYNFLSEYLPKNSGILKNRADYFLASIRANGNSDFADFVDDFINDELKYREGVSSAEVARHGLLVGVSQNLNALERMFYAFNKDQYNGVLFDRVLKLAKRFGVTVKFATRNADGSFISEYGSYNPNDNSITLDANLLVKGSESELCQTILHELIHSVVARAASIMTGRAIDKNNQFIDPQSLPKDVVDGINTLKEVYESIKDDGAFQDTYGKKDFEEMLSEITDPKFRGLLKAKKLWKKFLNGICKILGIADSSSTESDALTEIESALDNILSAAERGELDSAYASYLGQLADGYTLADLQRLGSGPVKTLLTQNVLFRTWIDKEAARASARDAFDEAAFVSFQAIVDSISNATGFKGKAKAVRTGFIKTWNEYQMEHQDSQQYVIAGMEAIMQETGNTPIEDYENYLFFQNQMQSRSAEEIETYLDRYYKPIIAHINAIVTQILKSRGIKETNRAERMKVYAEVKQYLIAKHGLERNKLYQTTKTRNLNIGERTREINNAQKIYDDKVNQINMDTSLTDTERQLQLRDALDEYNATLEEINTRQVPDIRDYSGLTALFGLDAKEYREAERLAQELVDNFENEVSTDELWAKINAATNKTLRHSYECGLFSRSQYEQIRDMFQYYIPLRGFDETTAEDVYSYSRFEGNSFSPAVKKAKGRTSVANDPIAYIITMATSEIIQGNHNKEKQALYHFVANRPNSLLSIRDCWYVKDPVTGNYIETYPDIAGGETWEDFESKMETLAKSKSAIKRKKGLDVGYRFQKPANKNLHYIHVMINGVERAIVVNGNPRLAEGVNGIEDSKHKDLIKQVKRVNRVASQLFTNYNYKFGGKNFIRDFLFAQTMMLIDESPMYNLRFAANWFKYNPFTIGSLMRKYRKGTLDLSIEGHRLFKEFIENGGKTGYVFIDELEKQKDRINAAVERMSEVGNATTNGVTKARVLLEVISYVNECIELAARFGTYATSRQTKDKSGKERSIMRSIDDAKNVTTNFNRKGAQSGRGFIGGLAAFMGSWNFFYNAAVQGVQRVWSSARKRPVKSAIFWGGWIALGYLMPYIIDIFRGDDDEEEDIYWNLPEYERKNNICMPFGKGKVTATISLSPQIRECYAIGVTLSDATFNKSVDKDATALSMEVASLLAKAFLPANPLEGLSSGLTPAENLIMFGTPDIADPIVEAVINKDWTGAPIEYRTTYNEGAPHYTKVIGKDDWKKSVGEKLYKLGEDNLDSSMDWNLSAWEHVIKGGSGGLGVLFKDISNVVHWITSWEAPERLNDIPVARTFLSSNAMDDEKFVNNIYWDMDKIYQKKMQTISKVYGLTPTEVFKDKKGKGNANLVKVYEAKAYPFLEEYYQLNNKISKKYRDIRNMPEDTEAQKKAKVIEEQKLFNMKRDLVYKLLEYEIE